MDGWGDRSDRVSVVWVDGGGDQGGGGEGMIPSTAEIRQFLMDAFSDEELNAFCFDYFTDVYNGFTAGQTKGQRIQLLDFIGNRVNLLHAHL